MNKKMSALSLTMLALGSIIGAGMFLGSGLTIKAAGPSVIIAYGILGIMMFFNLSFLAELSLLDPERGSFQTYAAKAFGTGTGFVIGWLYWISGILVMSSEVTAAAIFSAVWFPRFPLWVFVLLFSLILTAVNLTDPRGFGKIESGLSIIKILALSGFIIMAAVLVFTPWFGAGAGWHNISHTRFFAGGLSGFAGSLLLVFYAYSGTSVVGLAISESSDPKRTVPKVVLATSLLVTILYVFSILFILLLRPWTGYDASASPYVSSLLAYRFTSVENIMNFVILTATLSAMSASMFGASRMLNALAWQGEAPELFRAVSKKGVPLPALLFTNTFLLGVAFLSYIIPNQIYLLVTGASGLLSLVNVIAISLAHWRLFPRFAENGEGALAHGKQRSLVSGYPIINFVVAIFHTGIFIFALTLPGQRPSFLLGLALIMTTTGMYLIIRRKKEVQSPRLHPLAGQNGWQLESSEELNPEKFLRGKKRNGDTK